jgi:hypothetical protein
MPAIDDELPSWSVPLEKCSGNRRQLGPVTKQGSSMVRFLLVEAAQVMVRILPEWCSQYFRLLMRQRGKTPKVAMARRLALRLYWMWRKARETRSRAVQKFGSQGRKLSSRTVVT